MWGKRKKKITQIDSLLGQQTQIKGDIIFTGGLHIDAKVEGNINAPEESGSVLTLSEQGSIKGDVRVPNMIINGTVIGNVYAEEYIELALHAHITGNVYYNIIEVAKGAEVNGSLIRASDNMANQPALPIEYHTESLDKGNNS